MCKCLYIDGHVAFYDGRSALHTWIRIWIWRHRRLQWWQIQPSRLIVKCFWSEIDLSQPRHETAFWWRHNGPVTSQLTDPIMWPNYPLELIGIYVFINTSNKESLTQWCRWSTNVQTCFIFLYMVENTMSCNMRYVWPWSKYLLLRVIFTQKAIEFLWSSSNASKTTMCDLHRTFCSSPPALVNCSIMYELIDTWFLDSNRRVGVWSLPWHWHILSIPLTTGRGTGAETCGLDDVFPPDDLCYSPEALCLYNAGIYIYICIYICSSIWVLFSLVYQLCLVLW